MTEPLDRGAVRSTALLERSRLGVQQERILRHHQLLERHRQALASRPRRRSSPLVAKAAGL